MCHLFLAATVGVVLHSVLGCHRGALQNKIWETRQQAAGGEGSLEKTAATQAKQLEHSIEWAEGFGKKRRARSHPSAHCCLQQERSDQLPLATSPVAGLNCRMPPFCPAAWLKSNIVSIDPAMLSNDPPPSRVLFKKMSSMKRGIEL